MTRILVFGSIGPYTKSAVRTLMKQVEVVATIVRRPVRSTPEHWLRHLLLRPSNIDFPSMLLSTGVEREKSLYKKLGKYFPDLVVVIGFLHWLPPALVQSISSGLVINAHPALLPKDRGPAPPFWAFRRGDESTGVTLHSLSDRFDEGDIIAQQTVTIPRGIDGYRFAEQLGEIAGQLILQKLPDLLTYSVARTPQMISADDFWASQPTHDDFRIVPETWQAEKLFHFVRGARVFGAPWAKLGGDVYYFSDAIEFTSTHLPGEFLLASGKLYLAVSDGTVVFRLMHE